MRALLMAAIASLVLFGGTSRGESALLAPPNPALNAPDKLAWQLFLQVSANARTSGNNNALFETWASDADTFQAVPRWPTVPSRLALSPRALGQSHALGSRARPQVVPGDAAVEETRRNRSDFDYIVQNGLYKVSGLQAAFAANKVIDFPIDAVEVKANWVAVSDLPGFNGFTGSAADAARLYHVNTVGGKAYAMVAMHITTKQVPNWTWATFEHKDNPGRCDVIGCTDRFGAMQAVEPPRSPVESRQHYSDCAKTPALQALFGRVGLDPAFAHYCLKGSQTDFTDNTGLAVRLGNSVIEKDRVAQASCMTCHGKAAFNAAGVMTSFGGIDQSPFSPTFNKGPIGPIDAKWFWNTVNASSPPQVNDAGLVRMGLPVDFVWSIPFCAVDDTANPPQTNSVLCGSR